MAMVKDFLIAAIPWVVMGLSLAIFFVKMNNRSNGEDGEKKQDMGLLGMLLGLTIGCSVYRATPWGMGTCMSCCMLIGLMAGSMIEKKTGIGNEDEEK